MNLPERKSNRLRGFDYGPGAYFVTICTHERRCILSEISVGAIHESPEIRLTRYGRIADGVIRQLPERFPLKLYRYVIMPNHIHLLFRIGNEETGRALREAPLRSGRSALSNVIGFLKMNTSKEIHRYAPDLTVWQRSFHDHVVRNVDDWRELWEYVENNPRKWLEDRFYMPE